MKVNLLPVDSGGNYHLGRLTLADIRRFEPMTACAACRSIQPRQVLARLGGVRAHESLRLEMCDDCGHISYDRLPSETWLTEYYGNTWNHEGRVIEADRIKLSPDNSSPWAFIKHVRDLRVPKESRILDFGCGWGNGLLALQCDGYRNLSGVEIGTHRVAVARRYFGERIRQGSIEAARELVDEGGKFDLIILNHVAEHLRLPGDVVRELSSLLADDGLLVISVPHVRSESPVHLPLYFPHLHHFSARSLARLFGTVGFSARLWRASKIQLAVVGSRGGRDLGPNWVDVGGDSATDREQAATMRAFVAAPWGAQAAEPTYIGYFHPWTHRETAGFVSLTNRNIAWLRFAQRRVFPVMRAGERHGIDKHQILRRVVHRVSQLVSREHGVVRDVIAYTRGQADDDSVPWFTTPEGDALILVK